MNDYEEIRHSIMQIVEEWREILLIDPIWDIPVLIVDRDGAMAALDIKNAQYYRAPLLITEQLVERDDFWEDIENIVCHELIHLIVVDFMRTALIGSHKDVKDELRYKYEQLTVRLQSIISKLKKENIGSEDEFERSDTGIEE